jgi:hypothetical protein
MLTYHTMVNNMPYVPQQLKTESFIAGFSNIYTMLGANPEMRMIPIDQLEPVRSSLKRLGYRFRVVFRGPHRRNRGTLKTNARAFNVYFERR